MYKEIALKIGEKDYCAFLQNGFIDLNGSYSGVIHSHRYAEVHVFFGGVGRLFVDGSELTLTDDKNIIIIPGGVYHSVIGISDGCMHSAFQVNVEVDGIRVSYAPAKLLEAYFSEVQRVVDRDDGGILSSYLSGFLCRLFMHDGIIRDVDDYGFIIQEYVTQRYNASPSLTDLAELLHLSCRQTQRVCLDYFGTSFSDLLTKRRLSVARHLMNTTDMSLSNIAQYVGYQSYAGFYKAIHRQI